MSGVFLCLFLSYPVFAETLSSNNYRFDESTVGAGGLVQSSSTNFQGGNSLGDIAVGDAASANFQVTSPSRGSDDPTLSVAINTPNANFGNFSATTASTATASFSISNYTSYGYVVQLTGTALRNDTTTIPATPTEESPQNGTKQFGINLVANTSPSSIGSNPVYGMFGVGNVDPAYATPNKYHFVSGDTIASSPSSSGQTTYTITYMVNVDSITRGGKYTTDQVLIVTGTY